MSAHGTFYYVFCSSVLLLSAPPLAAQIEVRGVTYNLSKTMGTIGGVGPGWITLKSAVQPIQIVVSDSKLVELKKPSAKADDPPIATQILITGSADASYLVKDLYVTFTAELTSGKGTKPVTEMTLFTPKSPQDLSMIAGEGGRWSAAGMPNGTFLISGQIASFGKGQMMVVAPNDKGRKVKVTVDVSDAAKIAVNIADLSVVQAGDSVVEASGYIGTPKGGKPQNVMLAESLKIALAKPLMSKFKRRELLAANTPKAEPAAAPAKSKPAAEADPPKPAEEKPAVVLRDPSMPDKPEAAADGAASDDEPKTDEAEEKREQDPAAEEELIILDTFIVDENHTAEK